MILLRRQVRGGDGNATRGTGSHSQAGEVKSWKIAENCQNVLQIIFSLAKFNEKTLSHSREKEFSNKAPSHKTGHGTGAHWH